MNKKNVANKLRRLPLGSVNITKYLGIKAKLVTTKRIIDFTKRLMFISKANKFSFSDSLNYFW